ncbi:gas vesicle protein GvpO [Streptosporangium sp. NPDC087985]|uniref:gas vesicle protein GvpO n=1 Tax=Streptosporangium sp. NPDC087985 TaxID=3366196 RepID=UPI0038180ECC
MPVRRGARDRRVTETDAPDDLYEEDDETFDEDESPQETTRTERRSRGLSAATAGKSGLRYIIDLTSKEAEGVTFVRPEEDGWMVGVEVVEDRRIPSSGDILALYEVEMDQEGDLLSYRRTRRYKRGRSDNSE